MSFNGDLNSLIRLIFLEKNDVTFGVLVGLTLLVVVLMLVRSVMEEKEATVGSDGSIDSKSLGIAVEGALKKAMSDKMPAGFEKADAPVTSVASAASATSSTSTVAATGDLKRILDEREAKIAALMSDLDLMKAQLETKSSAPVATGDGDFGALQDKLAELQAKLSEYEIIEDDIADLSTFKDENKRLKEELEQLRAAALTAQTQVKTVAQGASTDGAPKADPVAVAQAAVVQAGSATSPLDEFADTIANAAPPAPAQPAKTEAFTLDTADDVMGEFAQAVTGGQTTASEPVSAAAPAESAPAKASPAEPPTVAPSESLVVSESASAVADPQAAIDALMANATPKDSGVPSDGVASVDNAPETEADAFGPLDTEKMLAEVSSMNEESGETASVLDEPLDTERLMAEMGITEPSAASNVESATAPSATTQLASEMSAPSAPPEDDPAAEFAAAVAGVGMGAAKVAKPAPVTTMTSPTPPVSETPVDDLLAEFKDNDFQVKGTKGS